MDMEEVTVADAEIGGGPTDQLVVLIHGTWANDRQDAGETMERATGDRWWQPTSRTWTWLQEHLPPGTRLPVPGERIFTWSGKNSQTERMRAADKLLALLLELEKAGTNYHLVAHSHGGSVVWEALVMSMVVRENKRIHPSLRQALNEDDHERPLMSSAKLFQRHRRHLRLDHLRSWTTVGTPFLTHLPRGGWLMPGWPQQGFTVGPPSKARQTVYATLRNGQIVLPVLAVAAYLTGLTAAGSVMLGIFALSVPMSIIWSWSFAIRRREQCRWRAIRIFGDRWLGLWSSQDEAIHGLTAATAAPAHAYEWYALPRHARPALDATIQPARPTRLPVPDAWFRIPIPSIPWLSSPESLVWRPATALLVLLTPLANWVNAKLSPALSKMFTKIVVRLAQGADLPRTHMAYVSPLPLPLNDVGPGLPDEVDMALRTFTNSQALEAGAILREALVLCGLGLGDKDLFRGLDRTLIHTAYFDNEHILWLIVLHILKTHVRALPDVWTEWMRALHLEELDSWYQSHGDRTRQAAHRFVDEVLQHNHACDSCCDWYVNPGD